MRKLKTSDLFTITKIVKKMNLKDEIKSLTKDLTGLSEKEKKIAAQSLQANLIMLLIENISNAEHEIYKLLADLYDKEVSQIADQSPMTTINMIKEIFSEENFGDFFSLALK